jgi:hypothetical protein
MNPALRLTEIFATQPTTVLKKKRASWRAPVREIAVLPKAFVFFYKRQPFPRSSFQNPFGS